MKKTIFTLSESSQHKQTGIVRRASRQQQDTRNDDENLNTGEVRVYFEVTSLTLNARDRYDAVIWELTLDEDAEDGDFWQDTGGDAEVVVRDSSFVPELNTLYEGRVVGSTNSRNIPIIVMTVVGGGGGVRVHTSSYFGTGLTISPINSDDAIPITPVVLGGGLVLNSYSLPISPVFNINTHGNMGRLFVPAGMTIKGYASVSIQFSRQGGINGNGSVWLDFLVGTRWVGQTSFITNTTVRHSISLGGSQGAVSGASEYVVINIPLAFINDTGGDRYLRSDVHSVTHGVQSMENIGWGINAVNCTFYYE